MIYLGTSGYSYQDWVDVYYPPDLPPGEWLSYYAAQFDAVEINYTYYRLPTAEHLQRFAERTGEDFCFSIKAHQNITHHREKPPVFAQFRHALGPLQREQKLGAVLLQFPYAFQHDEANVAYLETCFRELGGLPLVVEFRHDSWLTQRTLSMLREHEVAFCNVDMPDLPGLLPRTAWVTAPIAYVRLHGRNAGKWWHHEHAWERYDYTYEDADLAEWIPHLREMDRQAQSVYLFANNHWQGQSVSTVRQIQMLLADQRP
jgi:uncharacterized protein YecE (DUF72 family)